jgi:uncharacterized protein YebE (UPF0316 family)
MLPNIDSNIITIVIVPFLIFIARVVDVSMGTLRVIFVSKGNKLLAPVLGFFEILIWLIAMRYILLNLSNVFCYLTYAGGFATGTFVGIYLEEKISIGKVLLRVVSRRDSSELLSVLKEKGYTATTSGARSPDGKVKIIYTVIQRKDLHRVVRVIKMHNKGAVYSISDIKFANEANLPKRKRHIGFGFIRKGK